MKHLDAAFVDAVFEIGSWIIKFGKTSVLGGPYQKDCLILTCK